MEKPIAMPQDRLIQPRNFDDVYARTEHVRSPKSSVQSPKSGVRIQKSEENMPLATFYLLSAIRYLPSALCRSAIPQPTRQILLTPFSILGQRFKRAIRRVVQHGLVSADKGVMDSLRQRSPGGCLEFRFPLRYLFGGGLLAAGHLSFVSRSGPPASVVFT